MRKLIFIFTMCLMLGGSTSQSQILDNEEKIQPTQKSTVFIVRGIGDYGEVLATIEI